MRRDSFWQVDMLEGSIIKNLLIFAIPLMATNLLQCLYNAADMIVLGKFAGPDALAAVGATSATYNLLVNVFLGISTGAAVLVAQHMGAGKIKELSDTVHTSAAVSVILGLSIAVFGLLVSPFILTVMDTPADILPDSVLYLRIMFAGVPAMTVYNFGAAILRSVGDSRHPLYYLAFSGILNVILNLFFVLGFDMGVAGVAAATIISQYVSAFLVWFHLARSGECYGFSFKEIRICKKEFWEMLRIGIPTGIQSGMFSISNVLIQSAVNSFGTVCVAGNAASSNIENFLLTAMTSITQATMIFSGQNCGAGNYKRLKSLYFRSLITVFFVALITCGGALLFAKPLLGMYTSEPEVIKSGLIRLSFIACTYFICGFSDCSLGLVRGMGYSLTPMLGSIFCICVIRVIWLATVFAWLGTYESILVSYPVSWTLSFIFQSVLFAIGYRKKIKSALKN